MAAEITLKDVMAYFGMDSKQMMKEWKQLSDNDKLQIKEGIANGSLTY